MNSTRPPLIAGHTAAALAPTDVLQSVACPMCRTLASVTQASIEVGGDWRCVRCGQHWDARRLAAVAGYAEWAGERVRSRGAEADDVAAMSRRVPVERAGGTP